MVSSGQGRPVVKMIASYFQNSPVRYRLILLLTLTVLAAGSAISYFGMLQYKQTIITQAANQIKIIREARIYDIREHMQKNIYNLDILANQPAIKKAFASYDSHDFGPGETSKSYKKADRQVGEYLTYYRQKSRYYDMFLISPAGDVIYTINKEVDLGTNLLTDKYSDTLFADAFRRSKFLLHTQVSTIAYYAPSDEAAIFIVTPVFDVDRIAGFVAVQLDMVNLYEVITSISGLGRTGEVVAGKRHDKKALLVAPLRHSPSAALELTIDLSTKRAKPLQNALLGNMGEASSIDYRGIEVEAAWGYIAELALGIVIKIDREELLEPLFRLQRSLMILVLVVLLLAALAGIAFSRTITRPIEKLKKTASLYAEGQFNERSEIHSKDEIGQLARVFNTMADNIRQYNKEIREKNVELKAYGDDLERRVDERTATLAAANEEIRSFAYIVSHDLRSPLVNMKGFTGELDYSLKEITGKIESIQSKLEEDEQKEMLRLIEEDIPESMQFISTSVEKMDRMLSSILTLSRLGRRELIIESVDLHALCSDIVSSLAYQIEQAGTEVEFEHLTVIENDRMVMEQIMGNLIGNAVKYLDPERPGKIEILSSQSDAGISITVRDNGRGILPQEQEKVFQIFRRGIHQDVEGEGMGLPYVQTLVRAQGGGISFKPAPDAGTVFTVFLPSQKNGDAI